MATVRSLGSVQRGQTYSGDADLTIMCCPMCGVLYAIPETMREEAYRLGRHRIEWHCPNGHNLGYPGVSAQKRAEEQRDAARNDAARQRAEKEQAAASARAQKAAATRARNERNAARKRAAAGVCPCCGRTFKQLVSHMASKHPDYDWE